jgi:hypothetical protein
MALGQKEPIQRRAVPPRSRPMKNLPDAAFSGGAG